MESCNITKSATYLELSKNIELISKVCRNCWKLCVIITRHSEVTEVIALCFSAYVQFCLVNWAASVISILIFWWKQLTKQTCMYALERKYSNLPHRLLRCIWCLFPKDINV